MSEDKTFKVKVKLELEYKVVRNSEEDVQEQFDMGDYWAVILFGDPDKIIKNAEIVSIEKEEKSHE